MKRMTATVSNGGEYDVKLYGSWSAGDLRRLWTALLRAASKKHFEDRRVKQKEENS